METFCGKVPPGLLWGTARFGAGGGTHFVFLKWVFNFLILKTLMDSLCYSFMGFLLCFRFF